MVDVSETGFCSPAAAAVRITRSSRWVSASCPDGAVGGEAMMGTLRAALRAPALGNKGLINFP